MITPITLIHIPMVTRGGVSRQQLGRLCVIVYILCDRLSHSMWLRSLVSETIGYATFVQQHSKNSIVLAQMAQLHYSCDIIFVQDKHFCFFSSFGTTVV